MKKTIVILGLALLAAGCGAVNKTTPAQTSPGKEGQACSATLSCETGLNCAKDVCTSGKVGSVCATYKDCVSGLFCVKSTCSNPPSYTKYFSKIAISKMKQGMPPGPNNMPVPATEFKTTDAVEIDLMTKAGISGAVYYDLVNSTTGLIEMSSAGDKQQIKPGNWGTGFGIPSNLVGDFDLNVYYNDELVYSTPITISQ
jgi:hypothetical protein